MGKQTKAKAVKSDNDNKKKNTSLRLDKQTLKALKKRAIDEDTSVQAIIESLVELYLSKKIKISKSSK